MSWHFGFNLEYRFEVAIITMICTTLVVSGALLTFFFRQSMWARIAGFMELSWQILGGLSGNSSDLEHIRSWNAPRKDSGSKCTIQA